MLIWQMWRNHHGKIATQRTDLTLRAVCVCKRLWFTSSKAWSRWSSTWPQCTGYKILQNIVSMHVCIGVDTVPLPKQRMLIKIYRCPWKRHKHAGHPCHIFPLLRVYFVLEVLQGANWPQNHGPASCPPIIAHDWQWFCQRQNVTGWNLWRLTCAKTQWQCDGDGGQ